LTPLRACTVRSSGLDRQPLRTKKKFLGRMFAIPKKRAVWACEDLEIQAEYLR